MRQPLTKKQRKQIRNYSDEDKLELVREELHQDAELWYEHAKTNDAFRQMLLDDIMHGRLLTRPPQR